MKKISKHRLQVKTRLAKTRHRKLLRRKYFFEQSIHSKYLNDSRISAPTQMSFSKNYRETLEFLDDFRTQALGNTQHSTLYVDLTHIRDISVPVAIVLAAEFHRWSIVKHIRLRPRQVTKWSPRLKALFSDLGVFDLLEMKNLSTKFAGHDLTLSPLESGLTYEAQKIDSLQRIFGDILNGFTKNPQLYAGLLEAAENAINHAYPDDYEPRHKFADHRWWGASSYDLESDRLRFFIFDQGAGIPYTLPTSGLWEEIRRLGDKIVGNDTLMLERAFTVSRTTTGLGHRGLGLNRMRKITESSSDCKLRIISGKAELSFLNGEIVEKFTHPHHIGGTLVEWSMPADVFTVD